MADAVVYLAWQLDKRGLAAGSGRYVSLSHSAGLSAVLLSDRGPLGIDVERLPEGAGHVAAFRYAFELPDGGWVDSAAAVQLWTVYEACLKRSGRGLLTESSPFWQRQAADWRLVLSDVQLLCGWVWYDQMCWSVSWVLPIGVRWAVALGGGLRATAFEKKERGVWPWNAY